MKFEITDKSEYKTRIFTVEDESGSEYFVRFIEDLSYTSVEVESDEDGLLDEDDPRYKELVDLCEVEE